jgi:U3 small nucleolar ribonucleoprotein protein IMP4
MTIVTTSRKPVPELRSLARDFAFAAVCSYVIRGKMGRSDLDSLDPVSIFFTQLNGHFSISIVDHGRLAAEFAIALVSVQERHESMVKGIRVGDQSIYERLVPYIPVKLSDEYGGLCVFDGTRSRRYQLRLIIHET